MAPTLRFLHSEPQHEISSLLQACFARCRNAFVVAGFVTPDGVKALKILQAGHASKLSQLVVGAGTYQSFVAVDQLVSSGTPLPGVRIHLGHSQPSGGKKNPFRRYHPMLHSKIYLFEMDDGSAAAFVGSHNMTGFALRGLNGEAGLLIEGLSSETIFAEIRQHIDEAFAQAIPYEPSMKEAYAWWTKQYLDGLGAEANDSPRDAEPQRTIVILAESAGGRLPASGQVIYFEIAEELSEIRALGTEVHVHVFDAIPQSPSEALDRLNEAKASFSCKTEGLELGQGSVEVAADWSIDDRRVPVLNPVVRPFRPATSLGMQQVRVRVTEPVQSRFDYLFDSGKQDWAPEFDLDATRDDDQTGRWHRVKGLNGGNIPIGAAESQQLRLLEVTPESGSFILFSRRRRRLSE